MRHYFEGRLTQNPNVDSLPRYTAVTVLNSQLPMLDAQYTISGNLQYTGRAFRIEGRLSELEQPLLAPVIPVDMRGRQGTDPI